LPRGDELARWVGELLQVKRDALQRQINAMDQQMEDL